MRLPYRAGCHQTDGLRSLHGRNGACTAPAQRQKKEHEARNHWQQQQQDTATSAHATYHNNYEARLTSRHTRKQKKRGGSSLMEETERRQACNIDPAKKCGYLHSTDFHGSARFFFPPSASIPFPTKKNKLFIQTCLVTSSQAFAGRRIKESAAPLQRSPSQKSPCVQTRPPPPTDPLLPRS